jgi:hypothetical protein
MERAGAYCAIAEGLDRPFAVLEPGASCAGKRRVHNGGLRGEILVDALNAALAQATVSLWQGRPL